MSSPRTFTDEERQIAIHESGHAVAAWFFGAKVLRLSLVPQEMVEPPPLNELEALGRVLLRRFQGPPMAGGYCQHTIGGLSNEQHAVICVAGWEAEKIHGLPTTVTTWCESHSRRDIENAMELLSAFPDAQRRLHYLSRRAGRIVRRHWAQVEALAQQLLFSREMEACQVRAILGPSPRQ